jgi:hypothetical protein
VQRLLQWEQLSPIPHRLTEKTIAPTKSARPSIIIMRGSWRASRARERSRFRPCQSRGHAA